MMDDNKFADMLEEIFGEEKLNEFGKSTGFTQRLRDITPARLITSLIKELGTFEVKSIADLLRSFNVFNGKSTEYRAFYARIARAEFPEMMKEFFSLLIKELAMEILEPSKDSPLIYFKDILIQDGSSSSLKAALKKIFPGRFTKTNPAAVELHATFSARNDNVIRVTLTPDKDSERGELPPMEEFKDCLFLADRGYPSIDLFQNIDDAGGHYVLRLSSQYKPKVHGFFYKGKFKSFKKPVKLAEFLAQNQNQNHDLVVSFRGSKDQYRLVVVPNTAKRKKIKDEWVRLCTNLPAGEFPLELVGRIFRFRWQVELIFKEWKSFANLHKFDTANPYIAEGLIWSSLCAATVKRFLAHSTQKATGKAISTHKVAKCAKYFLPQLMEHLLEGATYVLRITMQNILRFCGVQALRSNIKREMEKGRLQAGLQTVKA